MTPCDFSKALIDAYHAARLPVRQHTRLHRGESRSVASEIEDLLAYYLIENVEAITDIRINQPMSIVVNKRRKTIKPDLVIVKDKIIHALVDLKMDLGYKREAVTETFSKAARHIEAIRGKTATYWTGKRLAGGDQSTLRVSKGASYLFVVVTDQNISGTSFMKVEAASQREPNVALNTLVRGLHPNDYRLNAEEVHKRCSQQIGVSLPVFKQAVVNAVA